MSFFQVLQQKGWYFFTTLMGGWPVGKISIDTSVHLPWRYFRASAIVPGPVFGGPSGTGRSSGLAAHAPMPAAIAMIVMTILNRRDCI